MITANGFQFSRPPLRADSIRSREPHADDPDQGSPAASARITAAARTPAAVGKSGSSLSSTMRGSMGILTSGALLLATSDAIGQVGLFDPSWRPDGRVVIVTPGTSAELNFIRAAGSKWMIGGRCQLASSARGCAVRLLANGDVDPTYGDPFQGNAALSDLAGLGSGGLESYFGQSDAAGRVWFIRNATGSPMSIGRINAEGTAATNPPLQFHFVGAASSPSSFVFQLIVAPDGSAYVIGHARIAAGDTDFAIARLTPELALDPTFNGSGVRTIGFGTFDDATAAILQPDGRLLVAGQTQTGGGINTNWAVRLLGDGSLDPSFGIGGRVDLGTELGARVGAIALDPQDRVLIAGSKQFVAGNTDGFILRLTPDGLFDTSFGAGGGTALGFNLTPTGTDSLNAILAQPDGEILVGGSANGSSARFLAAARVSGNGLYDPDFGTGGILFGSFGSMPIPSNSTDEVSEMVLDDQGRLMVAGVHSDGLIRRFGVGRIVTGIVSDPVFDDGFE